MEPLLSFLYNISTDDIPYTGTGNENATWKKMHLTGTPDVKVYTGGGITGVLPTPTAPKGTRDATIRPLSNTSIIPQVYIESTVDDVMYNVPLAGRNSNRYVFGVYINGSITSDLYLESWDTNNFTTFSSPVLSGTPSYPYSMINAIRTTDQAPTVDWHGTTTSGAACLKGITDRVKLKNASFAENECVYYNMYVQLPYDATLFHATPVEAFRYLYI